MALAGTHDTLRVLGSGIAPTALDRVLELLERRQLPNSELRVLLRLLDRDASLCELAEALDEPPVEIRRAGRSLAGRGLVRWRHVGRGKETRLELTAAGFAAVRSLLAAVGHATGGNGAATPGAMGI